MLFFPIIRTRIKQVLGGVNFLKRSPVGLAQSSHHEHGARQAMGLANTQGPHAHVQGAPVALAQSARVSSAGVAAGPVGLAAATRNQYKPAAQPVGGRIKRSRVDYVTRYVLTNAQTYAVGADDDWEVPQNFQDDRTPAEASLEGGKGGLGLSPKGGGVRATVIAPRSSKTQATITRVRAFFYLRQTGTLLGNGTLAWGVEGSVSREQLGAVSGDADGEFEIDITDQIGGDWSRLQGGLVLWVEGSSAPLGRSCFARWGDVIVESFDEVLH